MHKKAVREMLSMVEQNLDTSEVQTNQQRGHIPKHVTRRGRQVPKLTSRKSTYPNMATSRLTSRMLVDSM